MIIPSKVICSIEFLTLPSSVLFCLEAFQLSLIKFSREGNWEEKRESKEGLSLFFRIEEMRCFLSVFLFLFFFSSRVTFLKNCSSLFSLALRGECAKDFSVLVSKFSTVGFFKVGWDGSGGRGEEGWILWEVERRLGEEEKGFREIWGFCKENVQTFFGSLNSPSNSIFLVSELGIASFSA